MPNAKLPNYEQVMAELLRPATGPVLVAELTDQVLAARPSTSKNAQKNARQQIQDAVGREVVFLDADTVLPLRLALQGARFRLPLDAATVKHSRLDIKQLGRGYLPRWFKLEQLHLVDAAGQPIAFQVRVASQKRKSNWGDFTAESTYAELGDWFQAERLTGRDALIFTVLDWEQGRWQLEAERAGQLDAQQRRARNQLLADLFYEMLERSKYEYAALFEAVPTAYARLPDKQGYPADHWQLVVAADGRMTSDEFQIQYIDGRRSPFAGLTRQLTGQPRVAARAPVAKGQPAQVYRFKVTFVRGSSLWRVIEIQGKQTLAALDRAIRNAFEHDTSDHLSGFWKRIARAGEARTRFREVDLGTIDPLGQGEGAKTTIVALALSVDDQLKYVYDFGDWVEHRLTLEAVEASPAAGVKYPREVSRNAPKYVNCMECKKTVAKWTCLDCFHTRGRDVLLCDSCAEQRHEDHYLEALVY